jgi:hypothetical protein
MLHIISSFMTSLYYWHLKGCVWVSCYMLHIIHDLWHHYTMGTWKVVSFWVWWNMLHIFSWFMTLLYYGHFKGSVWVFWNIITCYTYVHDFWHHYTRGTLKVVSEYYGWCWPDCRPELNFGMIISWLIMVCQYYCMVQMYVYLFWRIGENLVHLWG